MTGEISLYVFIAVITAVAAAALAVTGIVAVVAVFSFKKNNTSEDKNKTDI